MSTNKTQVRSLHESEQSKKVVQTALDQFSKENPAPFTDLVVLIAAYNEAACIAEVLDEITPTIAELPVTLLVVDDGSADATAKIAAAHKALVLQLSENCGHGAALRAGYRIAKEKGAKYIATLDADGQWNPIDLPGMVQQLKDCTADFVIGSRALGATHNTNSFRNAGVVFFSKVISFLVGTKITDSSSGHRAMTVEVTSTVRQTQPQYQTSELLIGAALQGFRITEVPTVMRVRFAGESKKGQNLMYGLKYATVILSTFIREWQKRKK